LDENSADTKVENLGNLMAEKLVFEMVGPKVELLDYKKVFQKVEMLVEMLVVQSVLNLETYSAAL